MELEQNIETAFIKLTTDFLIFELEHFSSATLSTENGKAVLERLIKFHEENENYEICKKIIEYKSRMKDV